MDISEGRGPMPGEGRGPGRRWWGVVEDTPVVWIGWLVTLAKGRGVPIEELGVKIGDQQIAITSVELRFGRRYYFRCPICRRRCEAIYWIRDLVGCRVCLHLGYRSQKHTPGSPWRLWMMALERKKRHWDWLPGRYRPAPSLTDEFAEMLRQGAMKAVDEIIERVKIEEKRGKTYERG